MTTFGVFNLNAYANAERYVADHALQHNTDMADDTPASMTYNDDLSHLITAICGMMLRDNIYQNTSKKHKQHKQQRINTQVAESLASAASAASVASVASVASAASAATKMKSRPHTHVLCILYTYI